MTFTEAAVEILRLVGRPLHYKKITELAIERNLLSHVGKAPELTMSSRLATMVKKDRGEEPITKVKPGVFALRDFTAEMMALADSDEDIDLSSLPPAAPQKPEPRRPDQTVSEPLAEAETEESSVQSISTDAADSAEPAEISVVKPPVHAKRMVPGSEVFPEEDDDDEPILAGLDEEDEDDKDREGRRGRRRRRRGGKADGEEQIELRSDHREPPRDRERESRDRRNDRERERDRHRERDRDRDRRPDRTVTISRMPSVDFAREPGQDELLGRDLADAVHSVLSAGENTPLAYAQIAEQLVRRGRLVGDPAALAPTVSAAIRADVARNGRSRFRYVDGRVALVEWYLPREAARQEADARRFAERQREQVRRAFLRKLQDLPATGFVEMIATWLNAEGVSGLRAVRRPGSSPSEIHLAGVLRRGPEEVRVAVVLLRDGREIPREKIVEMRGSLHHYGSATAAWIVTTGPVSRGAREEVAVAGALPVAVFDGPALAEAMESRRIGLVPLTIPISAIDLDLLDSLRGGPETLGRDRGDRERGERDRGDRDRGDRDRERGERDRSDRDRADPERARERARTTLEPVDREESDRSEEVVESVAESASEPSSESSESGDSEASTARDADGNERTGRRRRRRRRGRGNASVETGEPESGETESPESESEDVSPESSEEALEDAEVSHASEAADSEAAEELAFADSVREHDDGDDDSSVDIDIDDEQNDDQTK